MTKNTRFSPEFRQRAVRMVLESQNEYDSQWQPSAPLPRKLPVRRRPCTSGFVSMSEIPMAVMADSPPLNTSD